MQGFQTFNRLLTVGSQKYVHATEMDYQAGQCFLLFSGGYLLPSARKNFSAMMIRF